MFKSFLKTAWRGITRNKLFSTLNIVGLAAGMAVVLLIGLWVVDQYSYDRFFPGYERAYQIKNNYTSSSGDIHTQEELPIPLAEAIKKDVPGIEYVAVTFSVTYGPMSEAISVGEKRLSPPEIAVGDDFLKIFQFPMIEGSPEQAFSEPDCIVLTATTAKALFGTQSALGKSVLVNNSYSLKVSGVLKDLPSNSSFRFGFLTSFTDMAKGGWVHNGVTEWNQPAFKIYTSLKPHVTYAQVEPQISSLFQKYAPNIYRVTKNKVIMQPVKDWHLYSAYENGVPVGGLIDYVRIFIIIGALVLLIACINFMNLSTARFEKRAKEAGIRKVVGSSRMSLILQFLLESVLMALTAFTVSLIFVELALPAFNSIAGTSIAIPLSNPWFWILMLGYILFTGLLAGSRPAFYFSSFKPVKVLKGKLRVGKFGALPRRVLVILQFSSSIALITATIVIYQQIQYARNRPRGYDSDRLLVTEGVDRNYKVLKQAALQSGLVSSMTASLSPTTEIYSHWDIEGWTGKSTTGALKVSLNAVGDSDYFKTVGITFKEGRNFVGDEEKDGECAIFNEAAIRQMQIKQPLNSMVTSFSNTTLPHRLRIIGVVNDALTSSPFGRAEPMVFVYQPWLFVITYRLSPNVNTHEAIEKLRLLFNKYRPHYPFQYHFVNENFAAKFDLENLVGKLSGIFAALAIFISCLGLFGLAAFVAEQRNKEIGIRKVLGASVRHVFMLVTKDFIVLVLVSCVIAAPVAFYFLQQWLQGYYYHISISPLVFLMSAAGALVIAIATISFQALKAAWINPVKSLQTE